MAACIQILQEGMIKGEEEGGGRLLLETDTAKREEVLIAGEHVDLPVHFKTNRNGRSVIVELSVEGRSIAS